MSAPMKKPLTDTVEIFIKDHGQKKFVGPRRKLRLIKSLLTEMDFEPVKEESRKPWREVAKKELHKHGEPAVVLRGARTKEGMSQKKLAEKLGIAQYNLSKMENGSRPISKKMAIALGKALKVNYRIFL